MDVLEFYETLDRVISIELFPPKKPEVEQKLLVDVIPDILNLSPAFLTCTYGAGGSTKRTTLRIASRVINEIGIGCVAHLNCVNLSRYQIAAFLNVAQKNGILNILAVRGDGPKGQEFTPHPDGFRYASELVAFIKKQGDFTVLVAGYPEGHPQCPDKFMDWQRCQDKVEAGGEVLVTQLFYDVEDFFLFDDYLKNKLGITVPIVPGILPILSVNQIHRMCDLCGATLPAQVQQRLALLAEDPQAVRQYGVELATGMCDALLEYGVPGIHFYSLNQPRSTSEILRNLGLRTNTRLTCRMPEPA